MTTWDMDTVSKVRRLFVELHVDPIIQHHGHMPQAREKAARTLVREAHALAVELDVADVQFEEYPPDDERMTIRLVAHWNPATREVELRGGEVDGTLVEIQTVGDSLRLARSVGSPFTAAEDAPVETRHTVFEMSGWDESARRWVYEAHAH